MTTFDLSQVQTKTQRLDEIAAVLKSEFFGLDAVIDRVMTTINAWYIFPDLITRPVIVNLWGLTGVGKTHLVRRLVELLEYGNRFVEVQMDGISGTNSYAPRTIANLLMESSIEPGTPGIVLLDEFQRYRTVEKGQDVRVERYQDVWMLLSDGKFAADASMFQELEMQMAYSEYSKDRDSQENKPVDGSPAVAEQAPILPIRKFQMMPYEAKRIKRQLQLSESVKEIMTWPTEKVQKLIADATAGKGGTQIDYTKTLIFISGNLDEAFAVASRVDDCDTDADVFHTLSLKIGVTNIKDALKDRFKPEQIARLGNNHIIYPSLNRKAYQNLIARTCKQYVDGMVALTKIEFTLDPSAEQVIYDNAVYPSQGTRPVFSSIHSIFSDGLTKLAFWAIIEQHPSVHMTIDKARFLLIGECNGQTKEIPINLDIAATKKKASDEFLVHVAVHEAGHALVYALLNKIAPHEVKINTASFNGGYMLPDQGDKITTRRKYRENIAVLYAGRVAEELVFGIDNVSGGAASDITKATSIAGNYVRALALSTVIGDEVQPTPGYTQVHLITNPNSDMLITALLQEGWDNAKELLTVYQRLLIRIVDRLLTGDTLTAVEFQTLLPELNFSPELPMVAAWKKFKNDATLCVPTFLINTAHPKPTAQVLHYDNEEAK